MNDIMIRMIRGGERGEADARETKAMTCTSAVAAVSGLLAFVSNNEQKIRRTYVQVMSLTTGRCGGWGTGKGVI